MPRHVYLFTFCDAAVHFVQKSYIFMFCSHSIAISDARYTVLLQRPGISLVFVAAIWIWYILVSMCA